MIRGKSEDQSRWQARKVGNDHAMGKEEKILGNHTSQNGETAEKGRTSTVVSVQRALSILNCLGESEEMLGVTEMSRILGLHKSTVSRLAATLAQNGYVSQDPETAKYRLGMRLVGLGTRVLEQIDLRGIARPYLEQLMGLTEETVHLGILDVNQVVYVDKIESTQVLTMKSRVGSKVPVHCTALGKVLLASLSREELKEIIFSCSFDRYTPNTMTNVGEFEKQIGWVREQGYAIDDEEHELGIRCVAAPIMDHSGGVIAAISVSGPTIRVTRERLELFIPNVLAVSRKISRALGYVAD
ncbi:MAG: IclR family transcriptional regulator [Firmicutes bacterium]|nr:IclR family transcriptional regulator [Bacillota bacterium]